MAKEIIVLYLSSVIAAFGADVAVTMRVNEILRSRRKRKVSYLVDWRDAIGYFVPIYNTYCFFMYGYVIMFCSEDEVMEYLEDNTHFK